MEGFLPLLPFLTPSRVNVISFILSKCRMITPISCPVLSKIYKTHTRWQSTLSQIFLSKITVKNFSRIITKDKIIFPPPSFLFFFLFLNNQEHTFQREGRLFSWWTLTSNMLNLDFRTRFRAFSPRTSGSPPPPSSLLNRDPLTCIFKCRNDSVLQANCWRTVS